MDHMNNFDVNLRYYSNYKRSDFVHKDLELLYILEGALDIQVDADSYHLNKNDFIVINANKKNSFTVQESIVGSFIISYPQLCLYAGAENINVELISQAQADESKYSDIRALLIEIFSNGYDNKGLFRFYGRYYRLLELISKKCLHVSKETGELSSTNIRMLEIQDHINRNYNKNISLSDLAAQLYMSATYLSRYIKKHFGLNFIALVNNTRLEHAVTELEYTDNPVTKVAMDVGFTNLKSFTQLFSKTFGMSPSNYRKNYRKNAKPEFPVSRAIYNAFLGQESAKPDNVIKKIKISNTPANELYRFWNRMINIGTAEELLQSDVQEHVIQLKNKLHFRYVRFWNIYTEFMYLKQHSVDKVYNFSRLDKILDFLVKNHLIPHIEIADKAKIVTSKSLGRELREVSGTNLFDDPELIIHFFTELARHLAERYGPGQVETWNFEFWMTENRAYLLNNLIPAEYLSCHIKTFDIIYKAMKKILPNASLGTGGFSIRYDKSFLKDVSKDLKALDIQPAFLSFYAFPYANPSGQGALRNRSTDPDYLKKSIIGINQMFRQLFKNNTDIFVTEWNITSFNQNVINDSVYKAAYIVKNIIDCIGHTDMLAYWVGSDLYGDYIGDVSFIRGCSGLLSRDGIAKPAWHAFDFINSLGKYLVDYGANYVVTKTHYDNHCNWVIICHNAKILNLDYYMKQEETVHAVDLEQMFTDKEEHRFSFEIEVGYTACYAKIMSINNEHGSVQDEWIRMNMPKSLEPDDIEYLKSISVPQVKMQDLPVYNGKIYLETNLKPNEVQLIIVKGTTGERQ